MNPVRLHVGSGTVYLAPDWVNVDVPSPHTYLACERPDLVERYISSDDDYYSRHRDKTKDVLRDGPLHQEMVCDRFGSFDFLPVRNGEVEEILCRHVFEHLSITEAHRALDHAHAVLMPNGLLRLDVPDHEETLKLACQTGDAFYVRHLLGPRQHDRGAHMMSYTRQSLTNLVRQHGFDLDIEESNIHEYYPAFCLRFVRQ